MKLEQLVKKASDGGKVALEGVITTIQDDIYYLALRMLVNPEDAKDATQEILIKIITKLSTFQFKSSFKTWVYSVATNYLLTNKKILDKELGLTFEMYQADLESDLEPPAELEQSAEYPLLVNEVRIACTMAMLLCLNQSHRLAYILGDIFELDHEEASKTLSMSKENYRKQLSRARAKVTKFTATSCGLISENAKCACEQKLKGAIHRGRVQPNRINFATESPFTYIEIKQKVSETQEDLKTINMQSLIPRYKSPKKFGEMIETLMENIE